MAEPVTVILLAIMALLFIAMAAVLTAADAAFSFLPRQETDRLRAGDDQDNPAAKRRRAALRAVLERPVQHDNALSFWRIWCEMAAAVAMTLLIYQLVQHIWLTGLIVTVLMAGVGFVLVGVSPRQLGRAHPLRVALGTAWLVRLLCLILGPIPRWLVSLGSSVAPGRGFVSEEEFRDFVERASAAEAIEDEEAELIQSVFDLDETLVRAVMVPRTDIVSITRGSSLDQALALFIRSGYSRIPVFGESSDEVLGVLYLKDVVAAQQRLDPGDAAPSVEQVIRDVRYVPESKPVGELLRELQGESTHVAIVIDEYGGTAGLVTLEDLIEELVGEIVDEYDSEGPEIEELGEGRYRVSARMSVTDLGEIFDRELVDDEVDTVGGLLAKILGRVPIAGSEARVGSIVLRAERLEGRRNRVSHLIVSLDQPGAQRIDTLAEVDEGPVDLPQEDQVTGELNQHKRAERKHG